MLCFSQSFFVDFKHFSSISQILSFVYKENICFLCNFTNVWILYTGFWVLCRKISSIDFVLSIVFIYSLWIFCQKSPVFYLFFCGFLFISFFFLWNTDFFMLFQIWFISDHNRRILKPLKPMLKCLLQDIMEMLRKKSEEYAFS